MYVRIYRSLINCLIRHFMTTSSSHHFNLLFLVKALSLARSRSHAPTLSIRLSWDYYKIGKKALFHKISRKYIDIYMYMYILSRVFLFPRFISPVAVVSRDTFLSLFCLPLFAYGVRVKGCTDSSRKFARFAKRKEMWNACKVRRKTSADQTHIRAKLSRRSRGGPWLALRSTEDEPERSLERKTKKKKERKGRWQRTTCLSATRLFVSLSFDLRCQFRTELLLATWVIKGDGIV